MAAVTTYHPLGTAKAGRQRDFVIQSEAIGRPAISVNCNYYGLKLSILTVISINIDSLSD